MNASNSKTKFYFDWITMSLGIEKDEEILINESHEIQ